MKDLKMKKAVTQTLLAAAIGGAMLSATPAIAASISINVGFPGIGFSYDSGGYCDSWGCPNYFWNYPIYYCPVYFDGRWYRGPFYYRYSGGGYLFWIRGGWRREAWYGPRPRGACLNRLGPPLDLDFYIWNGFNVRDEWRLGWFNYRNDWWNRRRDWDRANHNDTSWRNWLPDQQRNYDWNRERSWNSNREWTRPDWNRKDWERRNRINRGTSVPVSPPISPYGTGSPFLNKGGTTPPAPQSTPGFTPPTTNNPPTDMGGRYRDRLKGGQGVQGTQGSGGAVGGPPTLQAAPGLTSPTTNNPPTGASGWSRDHLKAGQGAQGTSGATSGTTNPSLQSTPLVTPPKTPVVTTPTTNGPPANFGGRYRDHLKSGQGSQAGSSSPSGTVTTPTTAPASNQPATVNPPTDNKSDRHKGRSGKDDAGTGTNHPQ